MTIKNQRNWRIFFATISTILWLRVEYYRGEFPIPSEYNFLLQLLGYVIIYPIHILIAYFWDNQNIYNNILLKLEKPIKYKSYLKIGFIFSFSFMIFYLITTFIFPVSLEYHYGR